MPTELVAEFTRVLGAFDDEVLINVMATLDGRAVATGSGWVTGTTVGLYNITTLEEARGRGLGNAVTARLMDIARERGCTDAVLHASEQGRPVYERLGFTYVCDVPQYVWMPARLSTREIFPVRPGKSPEAATPASARASDHHHRTEEDP